MGATSNGTSNAGVSMNGNSIGPNGYISMNSQMPQMPQGWGDLTIMTPMDPRSIISAASFVDNGGTARAATFLRSNTFIHPIGWMNPPMIVNTSTAGFLQAADSNDYESVVRASTWNGLHQMTSMNANIPLSVAKTLFLKADPKLINNFYLDWTGGTTSTSDIELSFRDNSSTSGIFTNGAIGTVPVFSFPANTYGGTGKLFSVTLLRTGRFAVVLRLIDTGGNYSMFEMDWIVL